MPLGRLLGPPQTHPSTPSTNSASAGCIATASRSYCRTSAQASCSSSGTNASAFTVRSRRPTREPTPRIGRADLRFEPVPEPVDAHAEPRKLRSRHRLDPPYRVVNARAGGRAWTPQRAGWRRESSATVVCCSALQTSCARSAVSRAIHTIVLPAVVKHHDAADSSGARQRRRRCGSAYPRRRARATPRGTGARRSAGYAGQRQSASRAIG
jgi:hypothetical protein